MPHFVQMAEGALGERFAGTWYSPEERAVHVGIKDQRPRDRADLTPHVPAGAHLVLEDVRFSERELLALLARAKSLVFSSEDADSLRAAGPDFSRNKIVVELADHPADLVRTLKEEISEEALDLRVRSTLRAIALAALEDVQRIPLLLLLGLAVSMAARRYVARARRRASADA